MSEVNYFILHGSFGNPFNNWFPYLRNELEKREKIVYTPDLPTGVEFQNYDNWARIMERYWRSLERRKWIYGV